MTLSEVYSDTKPSKEVVLDKFSYTKVLDQIADTSPVFRSKIRTLMTFHPPTALHIGRVGRTLSEVAQAFGLNPFLGAFAGLGHDHGRADQLAELHRSYIEPGSILNLHHVEVARTIFSDMAESELSPVSKADFMAVTMKHHEVFAPNGFAEPRNRQRIFLGRNLRLPVSEDIRKMQILLSLCDIADRAGWGVESDKTKASDEIIFLLKKITRKSGQLTTKELEWIKMPIAFIANKITALKMNEIEKDIMVILKFS